MCHLPDTRCAATTYIPHRRTHEMNTHVELQRWEVSAKRAQA